MVRDRFAEAVAKSLERRGLPGTDVQIAAIAHDLKKAAIRFVRASEVSP
jgi:hypothetical protein